MVNNNKIKTIILLGAIILLGLIVRLYQVGELPLILNRDEAALAYNAYLLKSVGQDEWQQSWPLMFKSFGDYKLPGYIYTLIPFFTVFGSSDFVVRLPSVMAGLVIIYLVYKVCLEIIENQKLALLAALMAAVLPVLIFYSRMAWEANLALALNLVSLWLLVFKHAEKSQVKQCWLDVMAGFIYLLSILTYNAPLLYLPLIIVLIVVKRGVKKWKKWLVPAALLSVVFMLGLLLLHSVTAQKGSITIFQSQSVWASYVDYRQTFSGWQQTLFANRYLYWLKLMAQNFVSTLTLHFLVINGGSHPWHNIPGQSHLFWSLYGLGLIGIGWAIFKIVKKAFIKRQVAARPLTLLYLLVAASVPAIITVDAPHATRSLLFFIMWLLIAMYGLKQLLQVAVNHKTIILMVVIFTLGLESSLYLSKYFLEYPHQQADLKPGFDVALQELEAKFPDKKMAVVADGYQYILAAWYLKLNPQTYFQTAIRQEADRIGLHYGQQVDNYHFIAAREDHSPDEDLILFWNDEKDIWQLARD